jgi:creatinine amidohydrolase
MASKAKLMEEMTVREVREAFAKGSRTVIVPLGVLEQHGYHLPLNTDILNALQISTRVSERTGALVAPALNYAFSGGELPGTINISPTSMALVVTDICQSLAQQGFRNILLVLGHGGTENINALKDNITLFLRRSPQWDDLNIAIVPIWEFSPDWMAAFNDRDYHAGYVETSLMMYWAPELVRDCVELDSDELVEHMRQHQDNYLEIRRNVDSEHVIPHMRQRPDIEVGVIGDPGKANAGLGARICAQVVDGVTALVKKME